MADCGLVNLGACLPQKFFEFVLNILNAPIKPFLNLTLKLFTEPINTSLFSTFWIIIVYVLSMFYALLLVGTGFSLMLSGDNATKRENSKQWLRNIVIMIVLIQASFFIYNLAIDLSSTMTTATLTLLDSDFFMISIEDINDLGLAIIFGIVYLLTLLISMIILVIRYAFVAVGVVLFPLAIFFYFFQPLKQYGSLLINFLGINIFVPVLGIILLVGFSTLSNLSVFSDMKIIILIAAFNLVNISMLFLMSFSIVKAGMSAYSQIKNLGVK